MAPKPVPLDDETIISYIKEFQSKGERVNNHEIARRMGKNESSIRAATIRLARDGLLGTGAVLPGFAISQTSEQRDESGAVQKTWVKQKPAGEAFEVPEGHSVKGVSALVDAQGLTLAKWIKTNVGAEDPKAIVEELEIAFRDFKPSAPPTTIPAIDFIDRLALYPWSDPHFGVMVWGKEAQVDWDLKIAVKVIKETFIKLVALTPPTRKATLLIGGDTVHSDTNDNRTLRSGNALQVDGRYPKIVLTACETAVDNINLLLTRHEEIETIVLGGNHDEHASFAIAFFLHAWYRNEPRVKVDISPSLFRFREFGKNMFGMTHTHTVKIRDFPSVMAARQPEMWGRTVHRFVHGFHVHHASKTLSEGAGCISETHQIIAPADAWHYASGYVAGRSLQSIVYDPEHGEVGRSRVAVV